MELMLHVSYLWQMSLNDKNNWINIALNTDWNILIKASILSYLFYEKFIIPHFFKVCIYPSNFIRKKNFQTSKKNGSFRINIQ